MKIVATYVYPNLGPAYDALARKFVASCVRFPAPDVQFLVVVNAGDFKNRHYEEIFAPLDCIFLKNDNAGYDIGAYQVVAQCMTRDTCDLLVCFGSSAYIRHASWATRIRESFSRHGDTLYGCMGHRGGPGVSPHIRTTGFWMTPALLNSYPFQISRPEHRYGFEHDVRNGLTTWVVATGRKPMVVAVSGEYPMPLWDRVPNGYHQNDQSGLLTGDRLTMPPYHYCE